MPAITTSLSPIILAVVAMPTSPPERAVAANGDDYVTLTISRDFTTYTTTILLGSATTNPPLVAPGGVVTATQAVSPVATLVIIPTAISPANNSTLIAATLCSILGAFVLGVLIWYCCVTGRCGNRDRERSVLR